MRVIAFLFGVILLFPGACALTFMFIGVTALPALGSAEWRDLTIWAFIAFALVGWGVCFLISYGGILIMGQALKPRSAAPPASNPPPGG